MKRVQENAAWSLFSANQAEQLSNVHGIQFNELYESFESANLEVGSIMAGILWSFILDTQRRTGGPSLIYKDAVNSQSAANYQWSRLILTGC